MLYNILSPYAGSSHFANLFKYITFRSGLAVITSFLICFFIGPSIISFLKNIQGKGQPIRDDGPKTHLTKVGTPTMGGIMIVLSVLLTSFLLNDLLNTYVLVSLLVFFTFALLGFVDDYLKVKKYNVAGIRGKVKLLLQLLTSLIAFFLINKYSNYSTILYVPFFKNFLIDLGYLYLPFIAIVIIGSSNAVNLTDGLDGLVSLPIASTALCLGIISYVSGNKIFADYLQIIFVPEAGELAIICSSVFGAVLGFLWYNAQPAEIFMGDTGSLALGSLLGIIAVLIKHEIVLAITGGVFVIEALSVIIQVYYFKATKGKRIFKMAPIHHHFEQLGWSESKVVVRFWIISILFGFLGLATLKLR